MRYEPTIIVLPCRFRHLIRLAAVLAFFAGGALADAPRQRLSLDFGWRFRFGDPTDAGTDLTVYTEINDLSKLNASEVNSETQLAAKRPDPVATHLGEGVSTVQPSYNDSSWQQLDLPHDWVVELGFDQNGNGSHGFKAMSGHTIGWYRHSFDLPATCAGKTLWLEFDGVYRNCLVWLNGHCLGRNVSGYGSFSFDITRSAHYGGTNVLVVRVDASRTEGWFYEGAGIYRHVWLVETDPVHVAHWGTFVTSSVAGSNATVSVQTQVCNDGNQPVTCSLTSTVLDAEDNAVGATTMNVTVAAGQQNTVTQTLAVANAHLWSLDQPYLYRLISTINRGTVPADSYETPFGVRTLRFDQNQGFLLNGQRVEIKGMCNHQDHAGVGSALPDRVQYYRIERLKAMGCNAYRTSHNPPTPELLEACDRLGLLIMDENRRVGWDAESLGELERMVRRDRNHPCVFIWSLGNEEGSIQGTTTGAQIMQTMQNLVHQLDSTRLCTVAMNGSWGSGFSTVIDVQGFNYNNGGLDGYHQSHPSQPCIGTEVASTVSTRGIYANDTVKGYVSAYDLNAPSWGATAEQWWPIYSARQWVAGGFVWTGFDYRGEPTPYSWPCINSHFGIMDTCGFAKDLFYYYQANWSPRPVLHILPHWNWTGKEGQPINVWAFSNCDSVDLLLNGVSQGRKTLNTQGHVEWNPLYAAGTLQAVGYRNGQPVLTETVETTGASAKIALLPDRTTILADARDVSVVTVAALDALGRIVPTASDTISFTISGGTIIGVGNGDPSCHEADKGSQRSVFNGLAEIIVRSADQPGSIVLSATSPRLAPATTTITAAAALPVPAAPAGVTAVPGDGQVTISWNLLPGAIGYNVKRATTSGGPYTVLSANTGTLGYTDTNVSLLTIYYYVVSAVNETGEGPSSTPVSAVPNAFVSGLAASVVNSQVQLHWSAHAGATGYNVKRSSASGGPYTTIAGNLTTTAFTDTAVSPCTANYYVVTMMIGAAESLPSSEVSATVPHLSSPYQSIDIGSVGAAGSASTCTGPFVITGSGDDIWNAADAFQFVYVPMRGDGEVRAHVVSMDNTHSNSKAAVMIRETLTPTSRHALADVEPSAGIEFLWRSTTGGSTNVSSIAGLTAPYWIRLTRTGNSFQAYCSANGVSWTQIGSAVTISMSVNAYAGLAVCSHNNGVLNTSVFDNVYISCVGTYSDTGE